MIDASSDLFARTAPVVLKVPSGTDVAIAVLGEANGRSEAWSRGATVVCGCWDCVASRARWRKTA